MKDGYREAISEQNEMRRKMTNDLMECINILTDEFHLASAHHIQAILAKACDEGGPKVEEAVRLLAVYSQA